MGSQRFQFQGFLILLLSSFCFADIGDMELTDSLILKGDMTDSIGDVVDAQKVFFNDTTHISTNSGSMFFFQPSPGGPGRFVLSMDTEGDGTLKDVFKITGESFFFADIGDTGFFTRMIFADNTTSNRTLEVDMGDQNRKFIWSGGAGADFDIEADSAIDQDLTKDNNDVIFEDVNITTPVNIYNLSHDSFADFDPCEHIDWENATSDFLTTGTVTGGSFITGTLTIDDGSITDSDGAITFGSTNLSGTGTLNFGDGTLDSLTLDLANDYLLTQRGVGQSLAIQNQVSNITSRLELFTKDGDGADNVELSIFAKGLPADITNSEIASLVYLGVGGPKFVLRTLATGSGTVLPLSITTGANATQLVLNIDNSIDMSGGLAVAGGLTVDTDTLVVDAVNNRVGIDESSPDTQLHINSDDGNIKLGTGVFSGKAATTDTGIEFSGTGRLRSGLFTEVNGEILSYGINVSQVGDVNTDFAGGIFRMDARVASPRFIIIGTPIGGGAQVDRFFVNLHTGNVDIGANLGGRLDVLAGTSHAIMAKAAGSGWGGVFWNASTSNEVDISGSTYGLIVKAGNVGISETAPQDKLEVNGTVLVKDKLKFTQDDGNEYIDSEADGDLDIVATVSVDIKGGTDITLGDGGATNYQNIDNTGDAWWVGSGGLVFGHMYVDGTQTIIVALTVNTPAEVEDDGTTSAEDGWLAGELNLVTFPTGGTEHYITVTKAGKYGVTWDLSFNMATPGANVEIHGGVAIDDTPTRNKGEAHRTIANNTDTGNMGGTIIIDCPNGNEEISLWVENTTNNADVTVEHGNIRITQIGGT